MTTIIPTFRRPALLSRAIRSVAAQTYERVTICVYDNASGDETEDVVREMARCDPRIRYYRHEKNIGATNNYNFGLGRVKTPYFSLLGDDDMLAPHFYEHGVNEISKCPGTGFFAGRTSIQDQQLGIERIQGRSWRGGLYRPDSNAVLHMIDEHFITTGVLFRRVVLDSVGVLDRWGSDRNYMIIAASLHPFIVSEEICGRLSLHSGSFSGGATTEEEAKVGLNSSYVLGAYEELDQRLENVSSIGNTELLYVRRRLWKRYERDVLYVLMTKALPSGRHEELRDVVLSRKKFRLSRFSAFVLGIVARSARWRLLSRLLSYLVIQMQRMFVIVSGRGSARTETGEVNEFPKLEC
ncbi:MAG: glycosyltransferase [Acidobacteria bacterium]|nr:glycosyltransferase [Acidobacteriota bacterium]